MSTKTNMIEQLTKAQQTADLLIEDLRGAVGAKGISCLEADIIIELIAEFAKSKHRLHSIAASIIRDHKEEK